MKRHKWKWSGNYDGKGQCKACALRTRRIKRKSKLGFSWYHSMFVYVQSYKPKGSKVWKEKMPPCA